MKGIRKVGILVTTLTLLLVATQMITVSADKKNVVKEGIRVEGVDVSNMTLKEVEGVVDDIVSARENIAVSLKVNKDTVTTTLKELGYKWENKKIAKEVLEVGKEGNVIKRYKDSVDLKKNGKKYEIEMSFDKKDLKDKLKELCDQYNINAKNASLKATGHGFKIIAEKEGCEVDYKKTADDLIAYVSGKWDKESNIDLDTTTKITKPKYTTKDCKKVSNEPMGSYSTSFSAGVVNRNANIKNGTEKLNGNVVYPGEQFSCNEHLTPWTEDNGWKPAGSYAGGSVVDSLGGGICQVSTTLYNALLEAEVKVVKRFPHSMAVSYVPLAADAALAGDYKDLIFENNTDAPIYIQGIYTEGTITFNIYGHDTRKAGHSVKYVSKTIKTIPVKTETKKDPTKPVGYRETTPGHVGYVAELYKVTYENGKEVNKELLHTSSYAMSPTTTIIGTKTAGKPESTTKKSEGTTSKKSESGTKKAE